MKTGTAPVSTILKIFHVIFPHMGKGKMGKRSGGKPIFHSKKAKIAPILGTKKPCSSTLTTFSCLDP